MKFNDLPDEILFNILNRIQHNKYRYNDKNSIDAYKIITMISFVSKQFNKISKENIKFRKLHPKSKILKGDSVRFTTKWILESKKRTDELKKKYGSSTGELPYGKLIISDEPIWYEDKKDFKYYYEYGFGGLSEGSSYGENLEIYETSYRKYTNFST